MSGSELTPVLMALIVALQAIGVALIQRGRKEDKKERALVVEKVAETAVAAAETQVVAVETNTITKETHDLTNSRYTELQDELRKSNERIIDLLQQRADRRAPAGPQPSEIIATEVPEKKQP